VGKARQKGTRFETAIIPWLELIWPNVERTGSAAYSEGDFKNVEPFFLEAKNRKEMKLGSWVKQAHIGAEREDRAFPIVFHKRRMFGPSGAYTTMTIETFVKMMLWALQQDPEQWPQVDELPDPLNPSFDPFEGDDDGE